jgi:hypothetical protein
MSNCHPPKPPLLPIPPAPPLPSWFHGIQKIWDDLSCEEDGYFCIEAQRVGCFQIDIAADSYVMVGIVQTMPTQDWSMRCWFSTVQYGSSITFQNDAVSGWNPNRTKLSVICLYTGDKIGLDPDGARVYPFKVTPGTYFLNVQNLFNGRNGGYLLLTNCTV